MLCTCFYSYKLILFIVFGGISYSDKIYLKMGKLRFYGLILLRMALWGLGLCVAYPAEFLHASGLQEPTDEEIVRQFNCQGDADETVTSGGTGDRHSFRRCGQDWSLKNGSEVYAVRMAQLNQLFDKAKSVRNTPGSEQDTVKQGLVRDHYCDASESYSSCYSRVRRRILADATELRARMINANTARNEIRDNTQSDYAAGNSRSGAQGQVVQNAPQAIANGPNPPQEKTAFEVISEMRHANDKKPAAISDCYQNPFVPCTVHYGQDNFVTARTKGVMAPSLQRYAEKNPVTLDGVERVQLSDLPGVGLGSLGFSRDVDVRDPTGGTAMSKRIGVMQKKIGALQDDESGSDFTKSQFQMDLLNAQRLERNAEAMNKKNDNGEYVLNTRNAQEQSLSWQTLNELLDRLEKNHEDDVRRHNQNNTAAASVNTNVRTRATPVQFYMPVAADDPAAQAEQRARQPASGPPQPPRTTVDGFIDDILTD